MSNKECPIWGFTCNESFATSRDGNDLVSPRAGGRYFITGSAAVNLHNFDDGQRAKLTTWLVDQRGLGVDVPEISTNTLDEIERRKPLSVNDRVDRFLKCIEHHSDIIGCKVIFTDNFSKAPSCEMLAWTESLKREEIYFLAECLEGRGWINKGSNSRGLSLTILVSGYARLAELEKKTVNSSQAFVAMWFGEAMNEAREAIRKAILDAGYDPLVIDEKPHNNKIDDEIIAEIRRSRFIVADFTHGEAGMRGGVYYEAGFARGLGLEVISTCKQKLLDDNKIHLDTRQYNHIGWTSDKLDEFRKALSDRISATVGDGPLKGSV